MTNFERIKSMSVIELATYIHSLTDLDCEVCPMGGDDNCFEKYPDMYCTEKLQKWLEREED